MRRLFVHGRLMEWDGWVLWDSDVESYAVLSHEPDVHDLLVREILPATNGGNVRTTSRDLAHFIKGGYWKEVPLAVDESLRVSEGL